MGKHFDANNLFMEKEERQTDAGKRFEKLLLSSKWKDVQEVFVKDLGIKSNQSQILTQWKKRGVSSKYANKAAYELDCEPHEISNVIPAPRRPSEGGPLTDRQKFILAAGEGLDFPQLVLLGQIAGWIKEGRVINPGPIPEKIERSFEGAMPDRQ